MGKLDDRLTRLEQAFPDTVLRSPYREEFERRVRIGDLYWAWWRGEIEKPDLSDPRDREWWEYMEMIRRVLWEMAEEQAEAEERALEGDEWDLDDGDEWRAQD